MVNNYLVELADFLQLVHPVTDFANKLGVSKATVSRYYSNKLQISRSFIQKLDDVYDINYKEFVKELKKNTINEPISIYKNISNFEQQKILEQLIKLKNDTEDYLARLNNTPKSAHIFDEILKTTKILQKVSEEIADLKNNL